MSNARETMSNVDAAWRHMEDPTNLMMVTGFMYFKDPLPLQSLRDVVEKRLLKHRRFRQRVVDSPLLKSPTWEDDADFNIDNHITVSQLEGTDDKASFEAHCSKLISEQLDFSRPLWHLHLIENVQGGNVLFSRIHHCIADGIALVSVMLSMTDEAADDAAPKKDRELENLSSIGNLFQQASQAWDAATKAIDTATKVSNKLIQGSLETLTNPTKLLDFAKTGTQGASALASVITYPSDPPTVFRGPLQVQKVVSWSDNIPLAQVKAIRDVTNATVNDVLLTAMSGALRRYLVDRQQDVNGLNFRAAVPVNLRSPSKMQELGNHFGLVFLSLPIGIADPLDRLWELKKRMDHLKNSGEAIITFSMLKAVGATPAEIQKLVVNTFGTKATCVMTNVPGPRTHLFLGGKRVDDIMFWVPCSGRVGMGISILSYAGNVRLGIATDRVLIPDPGKIIEGFYQEMESFGGLVSQLDS